MAEQEQQGGGEAPQQSEEELRAQLEEEIRKVKVEDVILQSLVSILNLAARRIAKDDERDLEQGKLGIDAAAALVDLVPDEAQAQLRQAISELQLLYAKHSEGEGETDGPSASEGGGEEPPAPPAEEPPAPPAEEPPAPPAEEPAEKGPAKGDSGLWTPPGS